MISTEEDETLYCRKCGFSYKRFSVKCSHCGNIDEEEWHKTYLMIQKGMESYEEEENPFEKAAEALLAISDIIQKIPPGKKKSDFCQGCGAPKEGIACTYCGNELHNVY